MNRFGDEFKRLAPSRIQIDPDAFWLKESSLGTSRDASRRKESSHGLRKNGRLSQWTHGDLLNAQVLRRLLTWLEPNRRPDLAVVLVDRDGDKRRKNLLQNNLVGIATTHVVAVAREEFEAWLVADEEAVAAALQTQFSRTKAPENMGPTEAKELLASTIGKLCKSQGEQLQMRRLIAERCSIEGLCRRCSAFSDFFKDLRAEKIG